MRRMAVLAWFVATLFLFSGCQKNDTNGVYEVVISEKCLFNHSVGREWKKVYTCDGKEIDGRTRFTVPLDTVKTVTVCATFTEEDKWPDVAWDSFEVLLQDGFETASTLTVTENKGRFKGNQAGWEINCKVRLIQKLE